MSAYVRVSRHCTSSAVHVGSKGRSGTGTHDDRDHAHEEHQTASSANTEDLELTALLVQYRSPVAAVSLPRQINARNALQAAVPAQETSRLFNMLGTGFDALRLFGWILLFAAGLGLFIALYNALRQRRQDLALMRALGAPRRTLFLHVLLEGLLLAIVGGALGIALGHLSAEVLGLWMQQAQQLNLTGRVWLWEELVLLGVAALIGAIAALLPAIQAYRQDVGLELRKH
ncbi:hypothetical protein CAI21_21815 [Alkalilimnicola ehrlichii]|nr:hypothetical protein CAI21_21815 [Alkalilimnicola ehrlichii]